MRKIALTFAILSLLMVGIISSTYGLPAAGTDSFLTTADVDVELADGNVETIHMTGPAVVVRGDPYIPDADDSRETVDTEMVALVLRGTSVGLTGPVEVRAGAQFGLPPSKGQIISLLPDSQFPAESFFDVFARLTIPSPDPEIPGVLSLINREPARIESVIDRIPPLGRVYKKLNPTTFVFLDPNGTAIARVVLRRVIHRPIEDPPVPQKRNVKKLTTTWAKLKSGR